MLSLDKYLSPTQAPTPFEAGLQHLVNCSLYAARLLAKDALLLEDLLENHTKLYTRDIMQAFLDDAKITDEVALKKALRQLRQRVMLRIIYRDLNQLGDLNEVMQTTSDLAEITIQTAVNFHYTLLAASYGKPCNSEGQPQELIVVGMGKLGGCELNVSSDVDLIFSYEAVGETQNDTNPSNVISNQDFFNKLGKKVISALDDVTEDGFVFRMDMRLRPFGSEGVLVPNCDALEEYYQNNGREWERYAWIKGRVVDGPKALITKLLKPFVFRRYLDYNALTSLRDLKMQIQRDVLQKGLQDNIKLGRGGIREIEFIAQVFQLIRGGTDASLQIKPTLPVLKLLQNKGLLPEKTVNELTAAYVFLRNLEHRLMYVDDQQTQDLPKSDAARARIANAMQFASWDSFLAQLNVYRQNVQQHFDATFNNEASSGSTQSGQSGQQYETEIAVWQQTLDSNVALQTLLDAGYGDANEALQRLKMLRASSRYQQLPDSSRQRFDRLMPLVIAIAAQEENSDIALLRTISLLENICRRASYLALLAEYPQALNLVIKLCAASPWLAQYLSTHPVLLDELLDSRTLYTEPDFASLTAELIEKMQYLQGDTEAQMDAMRHFKHATILRFAAQDVAGALPLEILSDYLSNLADVIVQVSLQTIWDGLKFKHIDSPKFAVIGYGKLGSKELGYMSDLDIIFIYDNTVESASDRTLQTSENSSEIYARFAQRINNWFNSLTNAGLLYETDLQLRPDGNSGLLVSSIAAFKEYQLTKAWVWEHQALTRARFIAGDANICKEFEQVRVEVLSQQRDVDALKKSVIEMREKMRASHKPQMDFFDIKHDAGGIIDVEFLVQFLVLSHAKKHPQLTGNIGNIALLKLLAELSIIETEAAEKVAIAYREYRKMQHALKLQGVTHSRVETALIKDYSVAVIALWKQVFN
ncbi:bifunctional [glutamate--ammonia ligase]-adenylyl-L-tyrosine phosphorylase/[glutamate--ammonia-ligase] adenylyltransferase [Methylotenera versatilis]|uniref:bifunctional [glutamate--ammonia ligase]-adenylyl-L-tyrosine phosphorylase/[glutamate--ammonia-ligase] adenylyltransferase n=1 Tax=Methylotenera versatilis TaxID=1055487 RepID=UPI000648FC88|nr:bifunctional [glutamate--ammonia ligase]-adenylyl-L-tyrosine phosphorylase/[glutamate--ammonia-ligase] adenylyltransferase [Methylotenera versatilis]